MPSIAQTANKKCIRILFEDAVERDSLLKLANSPRSRRAVELKRGYCVSRGAVALARHGGSRESNRASWRKKIGLFAIKCQIVFALKV